jgi:dTDP-4-dehydrorhamnose reductase
VSTSLLLTGASGQLGSYLLRQLLHEGASFTAWSGSRTGSLLGVPLLPIDLCDPAACAQGFRAARPAVVLHAAALARVGDCFRNPQRARQVNTDATAGLVDLCAAQGVRLIFVSTDLVFSGQRAPYRESDPPSPVSVYGQTKADAERIVLARPGNVVVRLSLLFGPALNGQGSFFDDQVAALRTGRPITLFVDEWRTPLDLASAARGLLRVARSSITGVLHLGGPERLSRLEMGQQLALVLGKDPSVLVPARREQVPADEPRPEDVSLDSTRWQELFPDCVRPSYTQALRELLSVSALPRPSGERG